jgi:hypothetical protein
MQACDLHPSQPTTPCYCCLLLQVQELLSDLQQAFTSGQEHFLGAVVTTRRGEAAGEPYWVGPAVLLG